MLQRTFRHVHGIGPTLEHRLWDAGILNWEDLSRKACPSNFPAKKWDLLQNELPHIKKAFAEKNLIMLQQIVPNTLHWRMIPNFWDEIAYLDIETTGYMPPQDYITTIAVYDGTKVHNFTRNENLEEFPVFIQKFPAIATFFGKGFDIPFIKREMHIEFPQIHFDIYFLLKHLGIHGGLKKIEKCFGLDRGDIEGVDGMMAVRLWHKYLQTHDIRYLNTLKAYNSEDVIHLEFLLAHAYNGFCAKENSPFLNIEIPQKNIVLKFKGDRSLVQRLLNYDSNSNLY
jgi:hypothetical protein